MNFKPILFSTPMVRAILEGRKTMTRRIVKLKALDHVNVGAIHPDGTGAGWVAWAPGNKITAEMTKNSYPDGGGFKCPYGQVGDVLWVREEHYRYGKWVRNGLTKGGREKWKFAPVKNISLERVGYSANTVYYYDDPPQVYRKSRHKEYPDKPQWYKRLARFMPKAACRIFLEITHIRVERLQVITPDDCRAEGIERWVEERMVSRPTHYKLYYSEKGDDSLYCSQAYDSFTSLWQSINGIESWEADPWVWVVSFKSIERPDNFLTPDK
jgi:hypothetical protein